MFGRYTTIVFLLAGISLPFSRPLAAQTLGSITGQITDESGASIPAATVTVLKAGAIVKSVTTNETGAFAVPNLPSGTYSVRVAHFGFGTVESKLQLGPAQKSVFNTQLRIQTDTQTVTVQSEAIGTVSVDPSQNVSALVLKQAEIDALPDDPDDLATDLQQLAGPSAGPNGGQIYIDGFTGGRLPPKESIREIRINQNPFSSEYDKLGYGRIEILTKPGSDKFHGQFGINDSEGIFNARNPLLNVKPSFSSRMLNGNVSGALSKKASFFFDIQQRNIDDNGIIVASVLNPNLNIATPQSLNSFSPAPQRLTNFSPRLDYQLNDSNTLSFKYNFERNHVDGRGIGSFSEASQGSNVTSYEDSIQVTETAVVSPKMINETRFRWLRSTDNTAASDPGVTISVSSAFTNGGSSTPKSTDALTNFELQNYTSITQGAQAIKFGLRLRSSQYSQYTPSNFLGSFLFAGGLAPVLDANNNPVLNADGTTQMAIESSLEQYRRTLLFESQGLSMAAIRQLGGGASQFSINGGNPNASIAQLDAGLFFQDDWRLRPNLTVNFGLRYEIQNQISDFHDFAPRIGFAWSPDGKGVKPGKTVIRGGSGIFYDRFDYSYSLNGDIYNGQTIQRYLVTSPNFFLNNIPSTGSLASNLAPQTIQQVDAHLRAPYVIQSAIGVERALPHNTSVAVNYINTRGLHQLRTVNINAPDPYYGFLQPYGASAGNIYNYESDGVFNQNQFIVTVNTRFNAAVSLFSYYTLNYANSNTDGIGTFPANQYNFAGEYSRAQFDSRNRLFIGGSVNAKYGLRLAPFLFYQSSRPFNITSGDDYLDSSLFNERPSFTDLPCSTAGVVCTKYGNFNTNPAPGETIIPRNYGVGPSNLSFNLRLSKTFGFGERASSAGPPGGGFGGGGGGPRGGGGPPMGGPRGMGGIFGDSSTGKKYNLTFTIQARNILNIVNYANPIGVITSPLFGTSNQLAMGGPGGSNSSNRRIDLSMRFTF